VGWSGNIDPRHQRRIIAAAIGVGCEKREVLIGSFLLEKDEEREDRRNGTKERWNP
jgi:hypothetical protein